MDYQNRTGTRADYFQMSHTDQLEVRELFQPSQSINPWLIELQSGADQIIKQR